MRQKLPNRRPHEVVQFVHAGISYRAGIGRFEDGRPAEAFLQASVKSGTAVETNARDGAVLLSLLLQHQCPIETIRRALTREDDQAAAGPIGMLLDLLDSQGPP
jgi:hypothetical protein